MILSKRIKAGVLPFVLAISLVVATICTACILLVYYHNVFILNYKVKKKLRINASSAMQYALATIEDLPENEPLVLDLYDEGEDSVMMKREPWGVFDIIKTKAFQGRHVYEKTALIGSAIKKTEPALYLADNRRPLSLAGDTKIVGDAFLPKAGIRAEYVSRIGYSRDQLVYGKTHFSQPELPDVNKSFMKRLEKLLQEKAKSYNYLAKYLEEPSFVYSFLHDSVAVYSTSSPLVINQIIKGKVVIASDREIVVRSGSELEDAILIAPKIKIEDRFEGRLQAFASDTVLIGERVKLAYPSAVCIVNEKGDALLEVGKESKFKGVVCLFTKERNRNLSLLRIAEKAEITGQVYVEGFVEHQGSIHGSLACHKFYLKTPATIYENYLFNGVIDRTELPKPFLSSGILNAKSEKAIIAWLH